MKIELYLNSEEYMMKGVGGASPYLRHYKGQVSSEYDDLLRMKQRVVELPDEVKRIKNLLMDLALKHNIEMKVYDKTRIRDALRAFFKGIYKTPTVIIGRHKLTGNITEEQIIKALKDQMRI